MGLKQRLVLYLRLMRIHAAASASLLVLLGALTMGQRNLMSLVVLFVIGVLFHIDGFVSNEYADVEVDRQSPDLQSKPLVSGRVSKKQALAVAWSACIAEYILVLVFFPKILPVVVLTGTILAGTLYTFFRARLAVISDFMMAGSFALFVVFGASTVSGSVSTVPFTIAVLVFFGLVFSNVVEGGLKDVGHDLSGGRKTFAARLGITVEDGRLSISKSFVFVAGVLITVCFLLLVFLGFQPEVQFWESGYLTFGVAVVLSIVVVGASARLLSLRLYERKQIKRLYAVINSCAGALLLLLLLPVLGWVVMGILLVVPIGWYVSCNVLLYGNPLQPEV
jgi:4-hydroxybenzoate polyprenyltransferase